MHALASHTLCQSMLQPIEGLSSWRHYGRITAILGMLIEVAGLENQLKVGSRVDLIDLQGKSKRAEIVGFRNQRALALIYDTTEGIGLGAKAVMAPDEWTVRPSSEWLGRVVNAFGQPVDGKGPLPPGERIRLIRQSPLPAHTRSRIGEKVDLGIRSINTFTSCCLGQRLGLFAASGIGKSVLMSMMARYSSAAVNVIGLVGERGREVQEFLMDELGADGLARSVVIVATSDESALMRRQAAHLSMAIAEYFRDEGKDVLLMMDSVTRFAMALREIGLAVGEPPTSKGYTPSVFAELPRLLERAGPGAGKGSITGIFTVLVDGDDHDEPIADAVRGILDGHIVLERPIAERGRYPAVNVLRSLSRSMPGCNSDHENELVTQARRYLAAYENMAELIRLGAYRKGSDPMVDEAIEIYPRLEKFLSQNRNEQADMASGYEQLETILKEANHERA